MAGLMTICQVSTFGERLLPVPGNLPNGDKNSLSLFVLKALTPDSERLGLEPKHGFQ